MKRYMEHMIRSAEKRTEEFLAHQIKDRGNIADGAYETQLLEAKPTIYLLSTAAAVYVNQESRFYHEPRLYDAMNRALDFVVRCQREDGSFDYPSCNFYSAADTSFCFKRLIAAYRLLETYEKEGDAKELKDKYQWIMRRALDAIATGGFHTPNHRWGIAAALFQGSHLFEEPELSERLTKRAMMYIREGIDGNADGEYAERSAGNYNAVVNNSMMALYEETGNKEYLGYVERNLQMMITFIDPDDTIFTQNSTRQDRGKADYPDKYFYQYLYMASLLSASEENCRLFDGAAHKIIRDNMERGDLAPDCLHIVMLHQRMKNFEFKEYGYLEQYCKFYEESGVVRVRQGNFGYSVLRGKDEFLYLKWKSTLIYVRIGESIGYNRDFQAAEMKVMMENREYELSSTVENRYYLPWKEAPDTSDWWKMDYTEREVLVKGGVKLWVGVTEAEGGVELALKAEGISRVPIRLQLCVPSGAVLENKSFCMETYPGASMILREGDVVLRHEGQQIKIGPGFGLHAFKGHYSGEKVNSQGYTIYLNEYVPFERKVRLVLQGDEGDILE